jgi:hypothetical protein
MGILATSEKEFIQPFNTIEDPREDGKILYPLSEDTIFSCGRRFMLC